jgi:hypothetical protein
MVVGEHRPFHSFGASSLYSGGSDGNYTVPTVFAPTPSTCTCNGRCTCEGRGFLDRNHRFDVERIDNENGTHTLFVDNVQVGPPIPWDDTLTEHIVRQTCLRIQRML